MLKNISDNKPSLYNKPLVSIMCITYNHANYIRETINGFLIQKTDFPVEIIIHDDASQDGTQDVIKEYEALYPTVIKTIYQTENQYSKKVDFVKQYILPKIKGDYIAYCEGDDYWTDPLKLQKQIDILKRNQEFGLVFTDINRINEGGNLIDTNFISNDKSSFCDSFEDYLIYAPFRAPCTWVFRKSLFYVNNKDYIVGDFPMLLDILANSKIFFLEDITANYRILTNSASHFTELFKFYSFMKGIFDIQMDYARKYNVTVDIKNKIQTRFAWVSYNFAVAENDIEQIKAANQLLIRHPKASYKFKLIRLLSTSKLGRLIVRRRLIKRLRYTK